MFDNLVESSVNRRHTKAGPLFGLTLAVYVVIFITIVWAGIMFFDPRLNESMDVVTLVAPPPPPPAAPPPASSAPKVVPKVVMADPNQFVAPKTIPKEIPKDIPRYNAADFNTGTSGGVPGGVPGGTGPAGPPPPPPPPPPPAKKEEPPPPKQVARSEGVIRGNAIHLITPPYPPLARTARQQGKVEVEITIDEQGNVISAIAKSGPPLLQAAAVQAARGSKFRPTLLSGVPVKVTGVLTYNFNLQ